MTVLRPTGKKQKRLRRGRFAWLLGLLLIWLFCSGTAWAGPLSERLARFPDWQQLPSLPSAQGDLTYPDWFAGTWNVTTTLVDLAAPLAPDLVTPGFEGNRRFLEQPIAFQARFLPEAELRAESRWLALPRVGRRIVADRAFNGLNLAKAYFDGTNQGGKNPVLAVKTDPANPNRQITLLRDAAVQQSELQMGDRQLISTITARATETENPAQFTTTEVFQQEFRGAGQVYLNTVETTTAYTQTGERDRPILADQMTAIYLSPQDPNYFKAKNRPVALYRYRLEFMPQVES